MIGRILVVMDPTVAVDDRQHSITRALEIAQLTGARIDLLLVVHYEALAHRSLASASERREFIGGAHAWLIDAAKRLRSGGFSVGTEVRWDHPRADAIVRAALELRSDLIVKQSQHDGVFTFGLFSNTDWDLAAASPVPVLFAKKGSASAIDGVLAAIELPEMTQADAECKLDEVIMQTAIAWGRLLKTAIYIGHAYEPHTGSASESDDVVSVHESSVALTDGMPEAAAAERKRVKGYLLTRGYTGYEVAVRPGPPWRVISDLADSFDCGLVVMGARDHTRWQRVTQQTHSEHALSDLMCDVLFVKEPDFITGVDVNSEELIAVRED